MGLRAGSKQSWVQSAVLASGQTGPGDYVGAAANSMLDSPSVRDGEADEDRTGTMSTTANTEAR